MMMVLKTCTMHSIWKAISCSYWAMLNIACADTVFREEAISEVTRDDKAQYLNKTKTILGINCVEYFIQKRNI